MVNDNLNLNSSFRDGYDLSFPTFEKCLQYCNPKYGKILVIGGAQIYEQAVMHPNCTQLFIAQMINHETIDLDTYFPLIDRSIYPNCHNLTKEILEALSSWQGTGPTTKLAIQTQLILNERLENHFDYKIEEQGYIYQFLLYSK